MYFCDVKKGLLILAGILVCAASRAEETDSLRMTLDEVSVTAIKSGGNRALRPEAVTVVGAAEVERLNILSMKEVSEIAPNFYIPAYGSRMTSSIYVRGIGARIDQPAVGLNVDNVSFLNKDNYDFDLVDIERIEVTRGPQCTMYGRNTMAGVVNIYTLSPMNWQGLRFSGEIAGGGTYRAALSAYRKFSPRLAMGLSANFSRFGGFFTNLYNGKKADAERGGSLRWKTVFNPSDLLHIENTAALSLSRQSGYPYKSAETGEINYNDTCFYRRTGVSDGLTLRCYLPGVTVSSITGLQYIDDNMTLDQDFLPLSYFTLTQKRREWAFTEDIVAESRSDRPYRWLAGLFGFFKRARMSAPVTFKETGIERLIEHHRNQYNPQYPIKWDTESFVLGSNFINPVYGFAAYHRSTYALDRLTLTAELRLDYEKTVLNYRSHCQTSYTTYDATRPGLPPVPYREHPVDISENGRLSRDFLQLLPRLSVDYRLPLESRSSLYLTVAKGYKAGGFNTQMFSDVLQQSLMESMGLTSKYDVSEIVSYRPEKSWNYELGAHLDFAPALPLRADVAAFYIDCRDQQLTMFPEGTTTGRIMANAGKTRSAGVELALDYRPTRRWDLKASWGFTSAHFKEFNNGMNDFSGRRIPYAPKNTLFLGATFRLPVSLDWLRSVEIGANLRGVGDIYWDEANDDRQDFYALLGANLRLSHPRYSLELWAENLSGTRYETFRYVSIGNKFFQSGKPRQLGVTLRLNFETK